MEILLHTYFGINLFVAGYYFNENSTWGSKTETVFWLILSLLFGSFFIILYFGFPFVAPLFGWIYKEISFQYEFRFTDYWDKILLDDNYSEEYKSREEKLKRSEEIAKQLGKQAMRHNKQIQKKYAVKQ